MRQGRFEVDLGSNCGHFGVKQRSIWGSNWGHFGTIAADPEARAPERQVLHGVNSVLARPQRMLTSSQISFLVEALKEERTDETEEDCVCRVPLRPN